MSTIQLTPEDLEQLKAKNISKSTFDKQLMRFEKGFPYLEVVRSADTEQGIRVLTPDDINQYLKVWDELLRDPKSVVVKFVPASGAASRMFKELFQYKGEKGEAVHPKVREVLEHLSDFAFADALNRVCLVNSWRTTAKLYQQEEYAEIITNLISPKGLNYGNLPKGLILFHNYEGAEPRTAAEEHLAEGALYAKNAEGCVRVHFTISPEHIDPFRTLLLKVIPRLEDYYSVKFDITHSVQLPETDTIAVDMNNQPLREADGRLVFRPGGHGALIRNLSEIDADVIFVKNIDNVVPDHNKCDTIIYKKALGGYLISIRNKVYHYMRHLSDEKKGTLPLVEEVRAFLHKAFSIDTSHLEGRPHPEVVERLRALLNRPIRVCGMVRNEAEPGGGPYIVRHKDGSTSLQILESTQIDNNSPEMRSMFEDSKYFNPVDLVCCTRDYRGQRFNLSAFVDEETGFISYKSKDGVELKALELPGLWNGAMSNWNTAFVEVPSSTFNPVKTVNDLLRPAHL